MTVVTVSNKTNPEKPCPEPKLGDINLEWAKIRPIKTLKEFRKGTLGGVYVKHQKTS